MWNAPSRREKENFGKSDSINMRDILVPALLFLSMQSVATWFIPERDITITPENGHNLFYVGENLTLHCHKTKSFDGDVIFKRGNNEVDATYITQVNDTYARMDKPVTADDPPEARYLCRDQQSPSMEYPIYTDYRPQNATNFSMIYLDKASLRMSWTNGEDNITYKNIHTDRVVKISAEYRKMPSGTWTLCEGERITTSCNVSNFLQLDVSVSLRVNVTNHMRNDSLSTTLPALKVLQHAKPSPVGVNSCTALSSREVACSVSHTWTKLRYRATACTSDGPSTACVQKEFNMTSSKMLTVNGLHPNYSYKLTVEAAFDQGFFSQPSSPLNVKMPEDGTSSNASS